MNSRPVAVLTAVLMFAAFTIPMISIPSKAVTFDPLEIPPGAPRPFTLQDLDKKGDVLTLTVVYKKNPDGSFQERPMEIIILETSQANRNPKIELARNLSVHTWPDVEQRIEDKFVNTRDTQMSLVFFNEWRPGDDDDWENATLRIRVDYKVENAGEGDSVNYLTIILVVLIIVIGIAVGVLGFLWIKRRVRDASTFFTPEGGLYYVFRDIDGSLLYFNAEQYSQMYNSNALVTYEYIGQAMKKGGPVLTPLEEAPTQEPMGGAPFAQPLMAIPLEAQPAPLPVNDNYGDVYGPDPSVYDGEDTFPADQVSDPEPAPYQDYKTDISQEGQESDALGSLPSEGEQDIQEDEEANVLVDQNGGSPPEDGVIPDQQDYDPTGEP